MERKIIQELTDKTKLIDDSVKFMRSNINGTMIANFNKIYPLLEKILQNETESIA